MKNKKTMKSAIVGFIAIIALVIFLNVVLASLFGIAYLYWPLLITGVVLGVIFENSRKYELVQRFIRQVGHLCARRRCIVEDGSGSYRSYRRHAQNM